MVHTDPVACTLQKSIQSVSLLTARHVVRATYVSYERGEDIWGLTFHGVGIPSVLVTIQLLDKAFRIHSTAVLNYV